MLYLDDATLLEEHGAELSLRRGHFAVQDGVGGAVRAIDNIPAHATTLRCAGRLVTRAFAIGHHHLYSALARGMPMPTTAPDSFVAVLERIWWNLDRQLDADIIRASALAGGLEALRRGCTFIVDHHSSPNAAAGSLHRIAEALEELGLGHLLCIEISDRDGAAARDAAFAETTDFLATHHGLVGLHASFTVGDATLERAIALADEHATGLHLHVAEAESDQAHCLATYGCRVVERLDRHGALNSPATILAHALHLADDERARLAERPVWVAQCTESNQNNAVGRFDPWGLSQRILIGTDGMHHDALRAARAAYLDAPPARRMAPSDAWQRLRNTWRYLAENRIADDANDLIVFDYRSPTPITAGNFAAHACYGLTSADVHSVIRQGRLVIEARRACGVDEAAILAHAREAATRLWKKL